MVDERIAKLEKINIEKDMNESQWDERYKKLCAYFNEHGHSNVPGSYKEDKQLANFVTKQRQHYRERQENKSQRMSDERIAKLEKIDFVWFMKESKWNENYKKLCAYFHEHGHSNVPGSYKDDKKLANFVNNQRRTYRWRQENKSQQMTDERISKLEKIDFVWDRYQSQWNENYKKLCAYFHEHGHSNVPSNYKEDQQLANFVNHQRKAHRFRRENKSQRMTDERIAKLEKIDFVWHRHESQWDENYKKLCAFFHEHGHSNVPLEYKEDQQLANFVYKQRQDYRFRQENKGQRMTDERISKLEKIDFVWHMNESQWNESYKKLCAYFNEHGHSNVPREYKEDKQLANFVRTQRTDYRWRQENKSQRMTDERISKLEKIDFVWFMNESQWDENYKKLCAYFHEHGHSNVPREYKEDKKLAKFVDTQRQDYRWRQENKSQRMTDERISKLEKIDFVWDRYQSQWDESYKKLCAYFNEHGHSNVPSNYKEDKQLANFVTTQRQGYRWRQENKSQRMTDERINLLENVGFLWSMRYDTIPGVFVNVNEAFPNPHHTLVPARKYSPFGSYNETLLDDGDGIFYRNGILNPLTGEWLDFNGPPEPYTYEEDFLFDRNDGRVLCDEGLLVDSHGFPWRSKEMLEREGYNRTVEDKYPILNEMIHLSHGEPLDEVIETGDNDNMMVETTNTTTTDNVTTVVLPGSWVGPMDLPREEQKSSRMLHDVVFAHDDERWLVYYDKLAYFVNRFGNANVPAKWPEDQQLATWVRHQRVMYKRYVSNKFYVFQLHSNGTLGERNNPITPWRIQRLYDLGFSFNIDPL